jgi:integrase
MPKNLYKRGSKYACRYIVPTKLRPAIGRNVLVRTTGTGDLREAERRSHRILADLHDEALRLAARAQEDPHDPRTLLSDAAELHAQVESGKIDYDDAAEQLMLRLETLRSLRGGRDEDTPAAADVATYRTAFGVLRGDVGLTLGRAADLFEAHQDARGIRKSTVAAQVRVVRLFLDWSGDLEVTKITRKLAAQWVEEKIMKLDAAPKTKSEHIAAMVTFFNYLTRAGHFEALNPFSGQKEHIRGSKRANGECKKTPRPWSGAELEKLAALPEGDAFRDVGLLCVWTGMRTDEAASLTVDAVNLEEKYLVVREGKNANARRYLPIHSAIVPAVKRMVARAENAKRRHLFDLKPTGADKKRAPALRAYRRMDHLFPQRDELLTAYGLRHTFATALERAGIDQTMRSRLLGHVPSDLASNTYSAGPLLEQMRKAVQKIDFKTFRG